MLDFNDIRLGFIVKTSQHKDATTYMVKRIDTEQRIVFLVPMNDKDHACMHWTSGEALFNAYKGA